MFRDQGCGTSRRNVDENSSFGYSGIVGRQEEDLGRPIQLHPPPSSRLPLPLTYSSVPDPALEGVGRKGGRGGAFLPSPCTPEKYLLFRRSASPKQMRCCVRRAGEAAPRKPTDAAAEALLREEFP